MAKSTRASSPKKKRILEDNQILEITPEQVTKRSVRTYLNVEEIGSNLVEVKNSLQNLIFKRNEETEKEIRTKRVYLSFAALVLLIILGIVVSKKSQAEVAMFYPSSCLGGWTNLSKATGKPEVIGDVTFSNLNSAILPENTQTDLFCGGFTGDIPPNKDPKLLILRIAWSTDGSTSTPELIEGDSFASSTGLILDAPASSTPSFSSTDATSTDVVSTSTETITETKVEATTTKKVVEPGIVPQVEESPKIESTSSPQSRLWLPTLISFLKVFTQRVYAQEANVETTPTEPATLATPTDSIPVVVPPPETPVISESTATGTQADVPIDTPVIAPVVKQEVTDPLTTPVDTPNPVNTSTESNASSTEDMATSTDVVVSTSTAKYPPFFEIEYTLDGVTWTTLGGVALEELQATQFEIPIPENATWDDLSKLQIHIKRVSNVDIAPTVFLDGITLEIETQDFTGKRRNQKVTDVFVGNDDFFASEKVDGETVNLLVVSSSTHGIAAYDASGTLMYTTQLKDTENYYPVNALEYGSYTYVITDDIDWCATKTYEECTASSTETYRGQIKFKVARPLY